MKEFTILQGNKKDVIQKESRNFRSQFTAFLCVSQILFWGSFHLFLAVKSLRSSLRPLKTPPCRTSVAKRQRESGAQGLGSFPGGMVKHQKALSLVAFDGDFLCQKHRFPFCGLISLLTPLIEMQCRCKSRFQRSN